MGNTCRAGTNRRYREVKTSRERVGTRQDEKMRPWVAARVSARGKSHVTRRQIQTAALGPVTVYGHWELLLGKS